MSSRRSDLLWFHVHRLRWRAGYRDPALALAATREHTVFLGDMSIGKGLSAPPENMKQIATGKIKSMSTLLAKKPKSWSQWIASTGKIITPGLYVEDGFIKHVGANGELPARPTPVIDLSGQIVLPGFVNTHHHLIRPSRRNLFAAQNNNLFPGCKPIPDFGADDEAARAPVRSSGWQNPLSGCTTVFDHTYVFKNGTTWIAKSRRRKDLGVRFHASRGSMSLGHPKAGCRRMIA